MSDPWRYGDEDGTLSNTEEIVHGPERLGTLWSPDAAPLDDAAPNATATAPTVPTRRHREDTHGDRFPLTTPSIGRSIMRRRTPQPKRPANHVTRIRPPPR